MATTTKAEQAAEARTAYNAFLAACPSRQLLDRISNKWVVLILCALGADGEMRYSELSRYIAALERSGGDANELKVERALKLAIPVTCIIIAIFGAPLATSTQRGGAAYGIGISLATTIIFLMLIQITKAIGQGGVIPPTIAAWLPNAMFGAIGATLLAKVRT